MSTFNIKNIITEYNLDEDALAKVMFPKNKFAKVALARIISGVSYLDTWQLDRLTEMLGIGIADLFVDNTWNKKITNNKILFHRNNCRVELDLDTHVSEIFLSDKLVAVETLITDKNIKLSEYLKLVNEVIINLI